MKNIQDIDFEDLKQQQVGFKGKCPRCMLYLFLILSTGMHASIVVRIVGIPMSRTFP
jgi:hypothetical protein